MAESGTIILRVPSRYAPKLSPPPEAASASEAPAEDAETAEDSAAPSSPSPASEASPPGFSPPPLEWLVRTWTVTHSTLAMWRSARNVRITYKELTPKADGRLRIDDLVEYEPSNKTNVLKSISGIDTQSSVEGGWAWRGKGLLFLVSSPWEVLAWGEGTTEDGETERWAVTWFAPTLFTKEGLDIYCDRQEGLSDGTYKKIEEALKGAGSEVAKIAEAMMPVDIQLPWVEKQ